MVVTGAKTKEASMNAAKKFTAIVQKVGFPGARFAQYKIQNTTATCDVGFPIRLEAFLYAHAAKSTYEPELFPGLVYRMTEPKMALLIFVSGKLVITGAKNTEDLEAAVMFIYPHLIEFRKKNVVVSSSST